MEKTKSLKEGAMHKKTNPYKIVVLCLVVFAALAVVYAATTITDSGITSQNLTLTGTSMKMSGTDSVIEMTEYSSVLGAGSGGLFINQTRPEAKGGVYFKSYDAASDTNRYTGWFTCHYNSSLGYDIHQHCSIETLDNVTGTPSVNSHFTISYASNQTNATIAFPNSNVYFGTNQPLYFGSDLGRSIYRDGATGNLVIDSATSAVKLTGNLITALAKKFIVASGAQIELYPNNQQVFGLEISNNTAGLTLNGLGSSYITIPNDNLIISNNAGSGNGFACFDTAGKLYRSASACA